MDQMNLLAVNLPAPVIQIFVFQLDRRFFLDNTVETAVSTLVVGIVLVGAAILDSVCIRVMSVMVNQTVQMDQMKPQPLVHHGSPKLSDGSYQHKLLNLMKQTKSRSPTRCPSYNNKANPTQHLPTKLNIQQHCSPPCVAISKRRLILS